MVLDCFPRGKVKNLLFNCFEGFNEGIIDSEAKMRGSMVKCGEILAKCGEILAIGRKRRVGYVKFP